jgi:hypothetical protein
MTLSSQGKAILQLLVDQIREARFVPDDPMSFMGYKEVHDRLGLSKMGPHWGASLSHQGLGDLASWLRSDGHPAVTGLIVSQENFTPGDGYFEVNGHALGDNQWWANQIRLAISYDWSPFVIDTPMPTYAELMDFTSAVIEGRVSTIDVTTRSRCEALRRRARQYYVRKDGRLYCEICGWTKPDNRFSGDIVELHHIRPLHELSPDGVTMLLKDAISSLAPLCPNCHRCAHSRRGDRRTFTMEELRKLIHKREDEPLSASAEHAHPECLPKRK